MLTETGNGVWRLQSAENGKFDNAGAAQTLSNDLGEEMKISVCPLELDGTRISAPDGTTVTVSEKSIKFFDAESKLKRSIKGIKRTADGISVSFGLDKNERIYGTGERFNKVNQRGKRVNIYAVDRWAQTEGNSYIPIPFVISSNISAVFFNRYEHSIFNITGVTGMSVEQKYAPLDIYVFLCASPREILTAYSEITGFAPVPPEWAFGTIVCRYHPEFSSKEGLFAMADAMKENDFPWEAVITEGWGAYKTEKRADLKEVSEKFHDMGKKVMVYEQCGRFPSNAVEGFGLEDKYAVSSVSGTELSETSSFNLVDNFSKKKMKCIDITSPECIAKWEEVWNELLFGVGIDGAKIDFCEQFPDKPSIRFADGRNPMAAHHWYPTYYNILRYKHFSTRPDGGLNFSRGGGIGAQRYPFVWAGDQRREFYFLKAVIKAALSCGLSGIPFVSWDMAGYQPSFDLYDKQHEEKVFIRGIEFTAFSPNIQTHGKVKRPYDFDKHTRDIYRAYTKLHDALRPYLVEQARVSSETGLPMMRHLFLYDASDEKCLDIEDEYMLGCGLLAAPMLKRKKSRNIYLPKGKWVNIFTGEEYDGGRTLENYNVPLEMIPVFKLENAPSEALEASFEAAKEFIDNINKLAK